MLAYATHRRGQRRLSPSALLLIGAGHAAAIGLLITAKIHVDSLPPPVKTRIVQVPLPPPPDVPKPEPRTEREPRTPPPPDSRIDNPPPVLPIPNAGPALDQGPAISSPLPDIGPMLEQPLPRPPALPPAPAAEVVRIGPRALTPADLLRPPYPEALRRSEEEAVLRLRLSIDARGRVVSVEPVGAADDAFLAAARSHLIRYWRYRPATEDGRPVASTLTITLRFELEE